MIENVEKKKNCSTPYSLTSFHNCSDSEIDFGIEIFPDERSEREPITGPCVENFVKDGNIPIK